MDGDTCEIASSWNALTCLTLLHARGCEMNHARCIIAAVRHGSRECVLWLKDFNGTRFDLKEMAAAAKAHIASPLRTLFERVNGIERRFGCFRSFLSDLVRDIARYGTDDERKDMRYPGQCRADGEEEDEGVDSEESEDEEERKTRWRRVTRTSRAPRTSSRCPRVSSAPRRATAPSPCASDHERVTRGVTHTRRMNE